MTLKNQNYEKVQRIRRELKINMDEETIETRSVR